MEPHYKSKSEQRVGDYVARMLKFLHDEVLPDNRMLKGFNLRVDGRTGQVDLDIDDENPELKIVREVSEQNSFDIRAARQFEIHQWLLQARAITATRNWSTALAMMKKAEGHCNQQQDSDLIRSIAKMRAEVSRYVAAQEHLASNNVQILEEKFWGMPQTIFFLQIGREVLVGRKLISENWIKGELSELFCSRIRAPMVLGKLLNFRLSDESITIHFDPFSLIERKKAIQRAKKCIQSEIVFPFPYVTRAEKREIASSAEGWSADEDVRQKLLVGEVFLRKFTIEALAELASLGVIVPVAPVLYDPACSTGDFLAAIKTAYPRGMTIGQDLSTQMITFAKQRLDCAYAGDAISSPVPEKTVDIAFLRFLNSEVVTTIYAHELFCSILRRVKVGGLIVVFGHTPVLLDSGAFRALGLQILRQIGASDDGAIFQFYILRRIKD